MKEFSLTDLVRNTAKVRTAALHEPVVITERKTKRFVIMSYEAFKSLIADLPPEEVQRLCGDLNEPLPGEDS